MLCPINKKKKHDVLKNENYQDNNKKNKQSKKHNIVKDKTNA
jgi:hypothetical protein